MLSLGFSPKDLEKELAIAKVTGMQYYSKWFAVHHILRKLWICLTETLGIWTEGEHFGAAEEIWKQSALWRLHTGLAHSSLVQSERVRERERKRERESERERRERDFLLNLFLTQLTHVASKKNISLSTEHTSRTESNNLLVSHIHPV